MHGSLFVSSGLARGDQSVMAITLFGLAIELAQYGAFGVHSFEMDIEAP